MSEERFLVTGALGVIGAWTVATLVRAGVPVVAFDLGDDTRRLQLILSYEELARVALVRGDTTDRASIERALDAHEITHVVHLAALLIPLIKADPPYGGLVNVVGTLNVFASVKERRDRIRGLAYASSIAAYDRADDPGHPVPTDAVGHPLTPYGVNKQANEGAARIYWLDDSVASVRFRRSSRPSPSSAPWARSPGGRWTRGCGRRSSTTAALGRPSLRRRSALAQNRVRERAETVDLDRHLVAVLQEDRRLAGEADPRGRASRDQVVGLERHRQACERNHLGDREDHLCRRRILHHLAVQGAADPERLGVGNLLSRDEARADGAERVDRLRPRPLAVGELQVAGADLVDADVAADGLERLTLRDIADALADDDAQLRFVVDLPSDRRKHDRLSRADERRLPLRKEDRVLGRRDALLGRMVTVVESDADDLAGPVDRLRTHEPTRAISRLLSLGPRTYTSDLLAGVEQTLRVEGALDLRVELERPRRPLPGELAALDDADAVLA